MKQVSNPPILHSDRCVLNGITSSDIPTLRNIVEDKLFHQCLPELYDVLRGEHGIYQLLSSFQAYTQNGEGVLWGIRVQTILIGFVAIMDMPYDSTIFYAMHPEYRNKGYARESVAVAVAHYKLMSATPLRTEVYPFNHDSLKILLSCGFKIAGIKDGKVLLKL